MEALSNLQPWRNSNFPCVRSKLEGGKDDDDSFDDGASTCAPSSVACSSIDSVGSTPDLSPMESPFFDTEGLLTLLIPDHKDARVCVVHHDEMQMHCPPRTATIYELPRRVIAIENSLKGLETFSGIQKRNWGNAPMEFLRAPKGKSRDLVVAYGSRAAKKRRLVHTIGQATPGSVWAACHIVEAPTVKDADLRLVHSRKHIDKVTELCDMAKTGNCAFFPIEGSFSRAPKSVDDVILNDDMFYSPGSLAAMKRAAGGAVEAVRQLFAIDPSTGRATGCSDIESSFAIVRPPGHHCCGDPNGFCFFNNTAVAASHARQVLGLPRVAIVDWDFHHGDGQQTIFYKDPTVLTISTHVAMERDRKGVDSMVFPVKRGMGLAWNGLGPGEGYNINIPWPHDKVGDLEYQEAFRSIVLPALRGFDPDLILVASGFDAVKGDVLAGTCLPPRSYYDMTRQLLTLKKPMAVILEGGYSPELLAAGSSNVTNALLGRGPPVGDRSGSEPSTTASETERLINFEAAGVMDAVRHRLNTLRPWSGFCRPGSDVYFHEEASAEAAAGLEVARKLSERINELGYKD